MKLLVVGQQAWGKGETVDEAFKKALSNSPSELRDRRYKKVYRKKKLFALWVVADDSTVNELGGVSYKLDGPKPKLICYLDVDGKPIVDLTDSDFIDPRAEKKPLTELFDEYEKDREQSTN